MIKAVLLDLDDTLLSNNDAVFIPAYMQKIEQFLLARTGVRGMGRVVVGTLKAMLESASYEMTNTAVALAEIQKGVPLPQEALNALFEEFYQTDYPALAPLTQPLPHAAALIEWLKTQDMAVVIATNPVYPTTAVTQRLEWGGISAESMGYDFISTGDNMHFTKPQPEYYAELIARVGVEPDEALMVGNSLENDILPAQQLGLHTYHVDPHAPPSTTAGTLGTLLAQLKQGWLAQLKEKPLMHEMILPELRGNLGALFGLLSQVKPHQWTQRPQPREWSILQIVCHLLSRERDVQRPRLEQICLEHNPFMSIPPQDNPPEAGCLPDATPLETARAFVSEREKTLRFLASLSAQDWQKPARHSIFSNTTLLEMAHFTAQHDRMHITQICQTLGRCQ